MRIRNILPVWIAILLLAACGGQAPPAAAPTEAPDSAADGAPTGEAAADTAAEDNLSKTLVLGINIHPASFDPAQADNSTVDTMMLAMYDSLVRYTTGTTELEPALAESWEISDDGLEYTFNLREGVLFHDGTELTAEDVKYTFDRIKEIGIGVADTLSLYESGEVVDPYTFRLTLSAPFGPFLGALPRIYILNAELVQEHAGDDMGQTWLRDNDAGSGPFKLVSFEPDQQVIAERFDDYWRGWEPDKAERVVWRIVKEAATKRLLLENGDLDWVQNISPDDYTTLQANPNLKVYDTPSMNMFYIALNTQRGPLEDLRVRRALALSYDYAGHVEIARQGHAQVAQGPLPNNIPFHDDTLPPSAQDLDAARALMAEAGYPDGGFSISMAYDPTSEEEATAFDIFQAGAAELGVEVQPDGMTWPAKVERFSQLETSPDAGTIYIFPGSPDPDEFFYTMFRSDAQYNFPHYQNAEVDELIEQGRITTDPSAREEIYTQLQQQIYADQPALFIAVSNALDASQSYVEGYQWDPTHAFTQNVFEMKLVGKPAR